MCYHDDSTENYKIKDGKSKINFYFQFAIKV